MAKVTRAEFETRTADPLLSDNYELIIPKLPSFISESNAIEAIRIQCKSTSKPGTTIQEALVEGFGHQGRSAGRKEFSGSLNIEFNENSDMTITKICQQWIDGIRATDTQLGTFKKDYTVTATLNFFKQDGSIAKTYTIFNLWCKSAPELQMDGSGSAVPVSAEFSYDYYE